MIGNNLLCRTATAYAVESIDEDRNPVYSQTGVTLEKVYINYYTAESDTTRGKQPTGAGTLYYDVQNSRPLNFAFKKGMRLIIDNENYTINRIAPFYNVNGLQHYEVDFQ